MISSMTGYAAVTAQLDFASATAEVKSVNSRYFELTFKLPDDFRALEPALRDLIRSRITRGKIECRLTLSPLRDAVRPSSELNSVVLDHLVLLAEGIKNRLPDAAPLNIADALRWPGLLLADTPDTVKTHDEVLGLFSRTLADFSSSRLREGEKLHQFIATHLLKIEQHLDLVGPRIPLLAQEFELRLHTRLTELLDLQDDHERLRQEVALYATRIDIDEELSRLRAHLGEFRRTLDHCAPAGKRLDFIVQELNRETNTMGAKSPDTQIVHAVIEIKLLLEQIREQIQNIE